METVEQPYTPLRDSGWLRFKKKLYARIAYNALARIHDKSGNRLKMLNLGMVIEDKKRPLLKPEDESEKFQFQLYHSILHRLDLTGKDVLEVGCGVGGGCYYMDNYFEPSSVIGIDLIARHISMARQYYKDSNIRFTQADACKFSLPSESVDVVVDLESSHLYPDFSQYVQLVFEVLKPGGYLSFADMRVAEHFDTIEQIFEYHGFEQVHKEDISDQVQQSIDQDQDRLEIVLRHIPFGKTLFRNFSFLKGSAYYESFKVRDWIFKHYLLRKPAHL